MYVIFICAIHKKNKKQKWNKIWYKRLKTKFFHINKRPWWLVRSPSATRGDTKEGDVRESGKFQVDLFIFYINKLLKQNWRSYRSTSRALETKWR